MGLNTRVLILTGLYNSDPEHWQSIWGKENPEFKRVLQELLRMEPGEDRESTG